MPKPLRDFIYGIIAAVRYRWFGKKESCSLPTVKTKPVFSEGRLAHCEGGRRWVSREVILVVLVPMFFEHLHD